MLPLHHVNGTQYYTIRSALMKAYDHPIKPPNLLPQAAQQSVPKLVNFLDPTQGTNCYSNMISLLFLTVTG